MSVSSGRETKRQAVEQYKGYSIIKVTSICYHKSLFGDWYDKNWIDSKKVHFTFCKEGDEKKPSKDYTAWATNVAECRECIDNFIKDNCLYYTYEERKKYITVPNKKNGWGFGYDSLMALLKKYRKGSKRDKMFILERLHDANFHTEGNILAEDDIQFEQYVTEHFPFREKFEVTTSTLKKPIKNPKEFEDGLKEVIENYFANQGVKDTSIEVRFLENW